jgi:inosose dehydratase
MPAFRVGNAPCSWGILEFDETSGDQIAFGRMLDELAETGYTGTELGDWGYMPTDPAVLRDELRQRDLVMLGAFVPVALRHRSAHEMGIERAVRTARLLAEVATDPKPFLVLADENAANPERTRNAGRITRELGLGPEEWTAFADGATEVAGAVLSETGLRTVFHHHCAGYVETPEEIAHFLELTDPKIIGLVFDTGHYAYGAGNCSVAEALRRFQDRVWYLHLKDLNAGVAERARSEGWDYFEALRHGVFCELGAGCVDFPAVLRWMKDSGYAGFVLVEQDILPGMGAPKVSALRNRQYLSSIEDKRS